MKTRVYVWGLGAGSHIQQHIRGRPVLRDLLQAGVHEVTEGIRPAEEPGCRLMIITITIITIIITTTTTTIHKGKKQIELIDH